MHPSQLNLEGVQEPSHHVIGKNGIMINTRLSLDYAHSKNDGPYSWPFVP